MDLPKAEKWIFSSRNTMPAIVGKIAKKNLLLRIQIQTKKIAEKNVSRKVMRIQIHLLLRIQIQTKKITETRKMEMETRLIRRTMAVLIPNL